MSFGTTERYKFYFCAKHPRTSGPNNPPIQRVSQPPSSRVERLEGEDDNHIHAVLRFRMGGSVTPLAALHLRNVARSQAGLQCSCKGTVRLSAWSNSAVNGLAFVQFCIRHFY
jgi:hypothetical protein